MVKRNAKRAAKPRARAIIPRAPVATLDKPAADLARLLADPCGAPVVTGISPGTNGSFVLRLEADSILFSGGTDTSGIFYWVPGAFRAFSAPATADSVGITLTPNTGLVPGTPFLTGYSTARCVAACAQIMYPGSEVSRAGVVSMGVIPAGVLTDVIPAASGGTTGLIQPAQVRAASQIVTRTPDQNLEVRWRPGQGDSEDIDLVNLGVNPGIFPVSTRGKNAIVITAGGLPVATGIRVRTVAVYEVTPKGNQGLVASVETSRSANTITQVIQALDRTKEDWWHGPVGAGIRSLGSMAFNYAATAMMGPAGGATAAIGQRASRLLIKY